MIAPPRRSVTRFFIPLIDVLILLFGIFLLMPFVSTPADEEDAKSAEAKAKAAPPPMPTDVKELQRRLAEAERRLERLQRERANLADRLSIRVLEIDPADGTLHYYDPDRQEIRTAAEAQRLIDRQRRVAGAKEPFFLILYPRRTGSFISPYPTVDQLGAYRQWFREVPFGFDVPESTR